MKNNAKKETNIDRQIRVLPSLDCFYCIFGWGRGEKNEEEDINGKRATEEKVLAFGGVGFLLNS